MNMEKLMVIRGVHEKDPLDDQPLFWSNKDGWVDLASADAYRKSEVEGRKYNLPIGGAWQNLRSALLELIDHWTKQGENMTADTATLETKPALLPPVFKKGTRVTWKGKDGQPHYGTVKSVGRKAPFTVNAIEDGGEFRAKGPFYLFKETDVKPPADEPSPMDKWGVTGYRSCGGDETECFEASITLNGKRVGRAHNDGNGGGNSYMGTEAYHIPGFEEDATAWAKQFGWAEPFEAADLWIDWFVYHKPYGVTAKKYLDDLNERIEG